MKKRKVKITKTGYLPDSPDRHNDMNIIPSNQITMKKVPFPIVGIDNLGNKQTMMPGGEYSFPGDYVTEIPMGKYQKGKEVKQRDPIYVESEDDPRYKNYKELSELYTRSKKAMEKYMPNFSYDVNYALTYDKVKKDSKGYYIDSAFKPGEKDYLGIQNNVDLDFLKPGTELNKIFTDAFIRNVKPLGFRNRDMAFPIYEEPGPEVIVSAKIKPKDIKFLPTNEPQLKPINLNLQSLPVRETKPVYQQSYAHKKGQYQIGEDTYNPETKKWERKLFKDEEADWYRNQDKIKKQLGGSNFKTKLSAEEEDQFKKFFQTLPDNLRADDSMYDIRGYWDASGRPEEFDYSQPTEEDGYYHAFSRHPETGKILKAPTHPTFNYAVDKTPLGDDTYVPLIGIDGNVYMRDLNWDSQQAFEEDTYKQGGIYLGKYEFKDGGLVKASEGIQTNFRRTNIDKSKVLSLQKELKNAGYDLGKSGKSKDGVDGVWGPKTEKAYRDFTNKKARMQTPVDSTEGPIFSEEDSTAFNEQIADTSSTLHNKALDNSLPEQVQQKNIKVTDIPQYTQSGLAVDQGFQPLETEDKYAYEIKNPDYTIPADTLNPDQFYYGSKRGVIELPDGTKQAFMETVPSQSIMGEISDVPYNPIELETQAVTEGTVDKDEYIVGKNKPNLFRESGTACTQDGKTINACISGVQLSMDMNYKDIKRADLGITGDSWEIGQNIIDKGGSRIYGLTADLDLDPSQLNNQNLKKILDREKKNKKVDPKDISNKSEVGDIVEMWYKDSDSQNDALNESKGNVFTTHAGIVSEKDGVKYVTHNVHGTWHSDKLEDVIKGKGKVMVSGITRPNYKVNEKELGVKVSDKPRYLKADDEERGLIHEGEKWSSKEGDNGTVIPAKSTEANNYVQGLAYYAPQVQQDFKLSDNETSEIMKLAFGVYGKESGFSHGDKYTSKRKNRKLTKLYKDIAPDWMFEGDEMSSGPTQIKVDSNFNTDKEKALLQKYGVDDKNIWDEKNAAAATLLETARNYERFKQSFGVGFDNMDPITMRNVLALAHNKGIDNVLKNEFTDISKAESRNLLERAYDYATTDTSWSESKLKGTKKRDYGSLKSGLGQYANLHKNTNSYANLVQDYSESLDVDYNKVKSNYWNAKVKPREEREHYDYTDWTDPSFVYDEAVNPVIDKTKEVISQGTEYAGRGMRAADRKIERGLKALEKKTRGAVNKIKKKVRMQDGGIYMGTYEFKDGGLVRMQEGGDMPFDLPLKEQNVYLLPEYNQPRNPETGEILPDPQRPNLGMDTGATEYKYTYGSDEGDIDVPSVVSGQYIGDQALDRYMLTGERFKTMNDPGSYSKFYDQIGQLGLMQEKNGGSVRKVKIKSLPRKNQ